jgi:hypothetical protein
MTDEISRRGTDTCRACGADGLVSVLDLGCQPLANALISSPTAEDPIFPLHLRGCPECGLGQVGEYVLPERIFGDYPYLSSMSSSWVEHAKDYAVRLLAELQLNDEDFVVEVASNDGYLLSEFQRLGVRVLGVEPARNVAAIAEAAGVPTISRFFGLRAAQDLVEEYGYPSIVVANNVLAHVPDLDDFVSGLAFLCRGDCVITVENPSYAELLANGLFDTIYHEHFSYLSAFSVARLAARHGLVLVRVEKLATHGGSNRYWLRHSDTGMTDPSVDGAIDAEIAQGIVDPDAWESFAIRSRNTIDQLRTWFDERHRVGDVVAGYGAAAKGNTLLNAAGIIASEVAVVTDASPEKHGRFLPGSHIPVIRPDDLPVHRPSDVLVLPWNIAEEVSPLIAGLVPGARQWVAVPSLTRIDQQ